MNCAGFPLIEGERYLRRDGRITGPLVRLIDASHPYTHKDPVYDFSYTKEGCLWINLEPDSLDLVAMVDSGVSGGVIKGMANWTCGLEHHEPAALHYNIDEKSGQATPVALKHDSDKIPYDLIPLDLLDGTARVFGHGLKKYGRNNYRLGFEPTRPLGAVLRHLTEVQKAIETGDNIHMIDSETGEAHLHHAVCSLLILIDSLRKKGEKV